MLVSHMYRLGICISLKPSCVCFSPPAISFVEQTGRKQELRERLMSWTTEQHRRRVANRRSGLPNGIRSRAATTTSDSSTASNKRHSTRTPLDDMVDDVLKPPRTTSRPRPPTPATPSGDDMENLFNRRKALREAKDGTGVKSEDDDDESENDIIESSAAGAIPTEEYLSQLAETFNFRTAKFSNFEVKEMYQKAKHADQAGDRRLAKKILVELLEATP